MAPNIPVAHAILLVTTVILTCISVVLAILFFFVNRARRKAQRKERRTQMDWGRQNRHTLREMRHIQALVGELKIRATEPLRHGLEEIDRHAGDVAGEILGEMED